MISFSYPRPPVHQTGPERLKDNCGTELLGNRGLVPEDLDILVVYIIQSQGREGKWCWKPRTHSERIEGLMSMSMELIKNLLHMLLAPVWVRRAAAKEIQEAVCVVNILAAIRKYFELMDPRSIYIILVNSRMDEKGTLTHNLGKFMVRSLRVSGIGKLDLRSRDQP
ncbi:hypothetical protein B0J17DRAFT_705887 [Rhizoctonia solani]|nr:hypothetical protein B0J17DRAFT_705887 [Rhizoctonia solani]